MAHFMTKEELAEHQRQKAEEEKKARRKAWWTGVTLPDLLAATLGLAGVIIAVVK